MASHTFFLEFAEVGNTFDFKTTAKIFSMLLLFGEENYLATRDLPTAKHLNTSENSTLNSYLCLRDGKVVVIYNRSYILLLWLDLICIVFDKIIKINMLGEASLMNGGCVLRLSCGLKSCFLFFSPGICFFVFSWLVLGHFLDKQYQRNAKNLTFILRLTVFY